ncbi:MAG: tyrosine-type recombinase/integrase [Bdellovibrionaceae bacterium]|nr:tyrosine-type recombinase/integrase [Pseudobdellovibrionaceae bacterium]
MGINSYKHKTSSGAIEIRYTVVAESINRFSGLRVQKKRRGISSKPKAERIYRELWSLCREERPDGVDFKKWGELVDKYRESLDANVRSAKNPNGFSPHVVRSKNSRLKHTAKWFDTHIELITPAFVSGELDELERTGYSRSHSNHILKEIKCVFTYALHMGAVKTNAFAGYQMRRMPKKRKEALTHEETDRLLQESKLRGHPYHSIWLLTLTLGLRRSELAGLQWIDIDLEQRLIYLRRQLIPREGLVPFLKDREERVVAIPLSIVPTLKELKLRSKTEFVIEVDCHQWREGSQSKVLRSFCREIGIKEVTHHQLRATHITLALIDGIPLGIVKENVGHAKLSTTDEYFRSAGINMRGQTDGLRIKVPSDVQADVIPLNVKR